MVKRIFDIFASITGLVLLAPFFVIIAIFIKTDSKGPVFFRQKRFSKDLKPFNIFKFRTMYVDNKDSHITLGASDKRITKAGALLRKYRIDEFPQLINVLKGEMSIVGPRPQIEYYVDLLPNEYQAFLSKVKPGITGLASVKIFQEEEELLAKCKNPQELDKVYINKVLPKKLRYDRFYANHNSFCFDIIIILKTIKKFLSLK